MTVRAFFYLGNSPSRGNLFGFFGNDSNTFRVTRGPLKSGHTISACFITAL